MADEYYQHDGINAAPESITPYDTHCPLMGSRRLNYFIVSCRLRQVNPLHKRYCYPACRFMVLVKKRMAE